MCMFVWTGAGLCLRACSLTNPAWNAPTHCHLWLHYIFRYYLKNGTVFGKKLLSIKCVFWFPLQLLFETFLILRRIQWDVVIDVKTRVKCPLFLTDFNWIWIMSMNFRKKLQISNFNYIRPVGVELSMRTERQTDLTKVNLAKAPENWHKLYLYISPYRAVNFPSGL